MKTEKNNTIFSGDILENLITKLSLHSHSTTAVANWEGGSGSSAG